MVCPNFLFFIFIGICTYIIGLIIMIYIHITVNFIYKIHVIYNIETHKLMIYAFLALRNGFLTNDTSKRNGFNKWER
jgi:hypothetical protein